MINCKFKKTIHLKDGFIIDEGANILVRFINDGNTLELHVPNRDKEVKVKTRIAHNFLTKFTKEPSIRTLFNWSNTGIAKSVTGKKCEPDGYGNDGSPSWMLVLGVI